MPEIFRTRDAVVFVKGATITVATSDAMNDAGWPGAQGVKWADSTEDEFQVDFSDGERAGFLLVGSNESSDVLTGMVGQQPTYGYSVLCSGTWVLSTTTFEEFTLASRGGGPLVPITYTANEPLYFSLRGLWTNEDEWTIDGDPRAPNEFFVGKVVQPPSTVTNGYLTLMSAL